MLALPTKGKKKAGYSDAATHIYKYLKEFNAQGSAPPAAGKKLPIISRLAGGIHAWRGDRVVSSPEDVAEAPAAAEGSRDGTPRSKAAPKTRRRSKSFKLESSTALTGETDEEPRNASVPAQRPPRRDNHDE